MNLERKQAERVDATFVCQFLLYILSISFNFFDFSWQVKHFLSSPRPDYEKCCCFMWKSACRVIVAGQVIFAQDASFFLGVNM